MLFRSYKEVCEIIKAKLASGVYEPSNAGYRTRWFCMLKKDGIVLRIVHSLEPLNKITIKHSAIPPIPDHMAEQFAGCACGALLDLYVGYDERLIAESSRDLTTFQTPFGALRLVRLDRICADFSRRRDLYSAARNSSLNNSLH